MAIPGCAECGYPVSTEMGQVISCPMCETLNEISQTVPMPAWLLAGGIGLLIGIIAGPAIIRSTKRLQ